MKNSAGLRRVIKGLVFGLLFLLVAGCGGGQKIASITKNNGASKTSSSGSNDSDIKIMMLGRSVMGGWFSHWTGDSSQPYRKNGFELYYREIEGPDTITDSVKSRIEEDNGRADAIFFKLCFVDFNGDDRDSAAENLKSNKGYVQDVYDIVVKKAGKTLIIGNALPQTEGSTSKDLVWNQREYNNWLNEFAASHAGEVVIFDEYGLLSDSQGNLKSDYAAADDDSHPNEAGYSALDGPFFALLQSNLPMFKS